MNTDLFERYGKLDPVATGEVVGESAWSTTVLLDVIDERNGEMQTQQRVSQTQKEPKNRWGLAVAAAAFVAVLLLGAIAAIQFTGDDTVEPANTTTTTQAFDREAASAAALVVAETYEAAFAAGDVATLTAMQNVKVEADRNMFEFNAAFRAAGFSVDSGECRVIVAGAALVRVECVELHTDPVFLAVGLDEIITPLNVYPDGTVRWQPSPADLGTVSHAYAEYLRLFYESEYQTACAVGAYPAGSIIANRGLALTGACGELAALHADAVAQWYLAD